MTLTSLPHLSNQGSPFLSEPEARGIKQPFVEVQYLVSPTLHNAAYMK